MKGGKRKKLEKVRLLPAVGSFQKYYRHHLLGPWAIYRQFRDCPEVALAFLLSPLDIRTDIDEQLASRIERISSKTIVETTTRLYLDDTKRQFKPGARGKGPGSPVRFNKILDQLDLTFDLNGVPSEKLLELLPKEFDRFRQLVSGL